MTTDLSPDEVQKKLLEVLGPPLTGVQFERERSDKLYRGKIGEHSFKIYRIIYSKNSFLPEIEGRIKAQGRGSQIEIEMKLDPIVIIFLYFWLSMAALFAFSFLGFALLEQKLTPAFLIPVGMLIFGSALPTISFLPEAKKSKQLLMELFQAREENSM